ncbi:amino acid ABC transporter substrate-binding protein [Rhodococcus sp. KBS0724]|uniref:ABC transporter substrate-binding protein n=1 Tax=Rhodococcus sp. KBS0724 TaxID=1179674 RepID=UPI00110EF0F5|nr:ABC transporter substrate-binding protein [Rhodococcus sp. KBS0724]TSD48898.1 amino acid ABC transporter substrate-binding protein [Rhodococcus sp. KBS0724]
MKRRPILVAAVAATAALTLSGCSGSTESEGGADAPYRVLLTGGLSGQGALAANSQTASLATKAGVQVQNAAGGIGGRQIELTTVEDAGDATIAVTKLREAINSGNKPDLYLNSGPSSIGAAVLPILKQNNILSLSLSPAPDSTDPTKFPLNFDLAPGATDTARGISEYVKTKGYNSVGVLHGSTAYGELFGEEMTKALGKVGVAAAGNEEYDATALDMTAQLQSLKNAGAAAIALDAYGAPLGYVLQSLERLGWEVPLIGNTSVSATNLIANDPPTGVLGTPQVKNLVTQVFTSTVFDPNNELVNTMVNTMASMGSIPSTLILADNYDAFPLVAAAAEKVGSSTDPKKLAEALETEEVQKNAKTAFLSRYNFSADSHGPNPNTSELQFISPTKILNGQFGNPAAS